MARRSSNCVKVEIPKNFADIINAEMVGRLGYENCSEFVTEILRDVLSKYWGSNRESERRVIDDVREW